MGKSKIRAPIIICKDCKNQMKVDEAQIFGSDIFAYIHYSCPKCSNFHIYQTWPMLIGPPFVLTVGAVGSISGIINNWAGWNDYWSKNGFIGIGLPLFLVGGAVFFLYFNGRELLRRIRGSNER